MARTQRRPPARLVRTPHPDPRPWSEWASACGRTITTPAGHHLDAVTRLTLHIRRCPPSLSPPPSPLSPEAEPTLPAHHEFGLMSSPWSALRYAEHRSVPEIHQERSGSRPNK